MRILETKVPATHWTPSRREWSMPLAGVHFSSISPPLPSSHQANPSHPSEFSLGHSSARSLPGPHQPRSGAQVSAPLAPMHPSLTCSQ